MTKIERNWLKLISVIKHAPFKMLLIMENRTAAAQERNSTTYNYCDKLNTIQTV